MSSSLGEFVRKLALGFYIYSYNHSNHQTPRPAGCVVQSCQRARTRLVSGNNLHTPERLQTWASQIFISSKSFASRLAIDFGCLETSADDALASSICVNAQTIPTHDT